MQVTRIVLGSYATNCYIVQGANKEECILIDPADNADYLISYLSSKNITPKAIITTHGHYDHILAIPGLQQKWPELPVYCHPLDISNELYEYDMGQRYPTLNSMKNKVLVGDGDILNLVGIKFRVIHTPGHTEGSIILQTEDSIFTGDTLFRGSIGRTDFEGGDIIKMMASLKKINNLDMEDATVFPGHDIISSLEWERKNNPYLIGL